MNLNMQPPDGEEEPLTICDECGCELPVSQAVDGPQGTICEGDTLCPSCLADWELP